eukprot:TRINITY_DN9787_c0_g1_i1.p1 TRINITY_DN9787_c0_g1~~TRINITY_DN9787_c0_g1_i1.p1  ORF type:complete len:371 (+),score=132.57 TRINITY_DN9787_c0_g1_i1:79-1113(+)
MKHPMKGVDRVIVEDVADYRAAIPYIVKPGDCVLEVGCHEGVTTRRIAHQAGDSGVVIGVDTSDVCIERANCAYENQANLSFMVGDALNVSELNKLPPRPFDVIFLDISGSRELETLIPVMNAYENALKPRTLVVKSFKLKRLFVNCRLFEHIPAAPGAKGEKVLEDPAPGGEAPRTRAQKQGEGEWSLVVPQPRFPLEVSAWAKQAKGVLPKGEDGAVDQAKLQANARRNKGLEAWGQGRETRRQRQKQKNALRAQDKENNTAETAQLAQRNVLFQDELHGRATIEREYKSLTVKLGKDGRTHLKHAAKAAGDTCRAVLHWSNAVGPITWTLREAHADPVPPS